MLVDSLTAKTEAPASFKKIVFSVRKTMKLRQDNAKEFLSNQFETFYLDSGILKEKTTPTMQQQNRLTERCNRTLLKMARRLLIYSELPKMMWEAEILHASRTKNWVVGQRKDRCPADLVRGMKPKSPFSKLSNSACTLFTRERDREVSKSKALEGKLMGNTE